MDSKELRACVGEPIDDISDDWDWGDVADKSSEATELVGDWSAFIALSLVLMRCFRFFFRARTTLTSLSRTNLPWTPSVGSSITRSQRVVRHGHLPVQAT